MESSGTSLESLKGSYNEIISRTGLKDSDAVKTNRVYVTSGAINGGIPSVVGDLYYAKLAHPDLFEDIDPVIVYQELMKNFFEIELKGEGLIYPEV